MFGRATIRLGIGPHSSIALVLVRFSLNFFCAFLIDDTCSKSDENCNWRVFTVLILEVLNNLLS